MTDKGQMTPEELELRVKAAMGLPLQEFLGIKLENMAAGSSEILLPPTAKSINAGGVIHGGIIYSLLDVSANMAMLPLLKKNQNAVTLDMHSSVLRAAPIDKPLLFKGVVRKIGKRMIFCDSEAWSEEKLIATGRVTKSIIEIEG